VKPTGEDVELAQVVTPPPAQEVVAETAAPPQAAETLPATASSLPLMAFFGLLALGLAWTLRLVQKRSL
jgi:MYXO-CTERM domain-containing protein